MKHIKEFTLFEAIDQEEKELLKKINSDQMIRNWLNQCDMEEDEIGIYYDEVDVKTPYGTTFKTTFSEPAWEYTGEGDWEATIYAKGDFSLEYTCDGHIKSIGYPEDDGDAEWDEVYADITDPIKFCDEIFERDPLIASKVYSLLPDDKKEAVNIRLTNKGVNLDVLTGANLLNRLG